MLKTAGLALLACAALTGSLAYAVHLGEKNCEARHAQATVTSQKNAIHVALEVADDFAKLGTVLASKIENVRVETHETVKTQVQYVHDHPLPAVCKLGDPLIELRNSQIRSLYRSAGSELPAEGNGKGTAPAADKHK